MSDAFSPPERRQEQNSASAPDSYFKSRLPFLRSAAGVFDPFDAPRIGHLVTPVRLSDFPVA